MVKSTSGKFTTMYVPECPTLGLIRGMVLAKENFETEQLDLLKFTNHENNGDELIIEVQDNSVLELSSKV